MCNTTNNLRLPEADIIHVSAPLPPHDSYLSTNQCFSAIAARLGLISSSSEPALPIGTATAASKAATSLGVETPLDHKSRGSSPGGSPVRSLSRSVSRGVSPASPLRWVPALLHRVHSRDEPFIPVDPFRVHWHRRRRRKPQPPLDQHGDDDVHCADILCMPCTLANTCCGCLSHGDSVQSAVHLFTDTIPRQAYLHLQLRLPSLYWGRVCRIFEDAEISRAETQRMIDACRVDGSAFLSVGRSGRVNAAQGANGNGMGLSNGNGNGQGIGDGIAQRLQGAGLRPGYGRRVSAREHWSRLLPLPEDWTPPNVSPAMARFKNSWEAFVDSVMREWKTLNIVSALLLS
jgi:hypothetical protein